MPLLKTPAQVSDLLCLLGLPLVSAVSGTHARRICVACGTGGRARSSGGGLGNQQISESHDNPEDMANGVRPGRDIQQTR